MSPVVTIANAIKVFIAVALVVTAGWWIWSGRDDTFRYRLTVEVESDGKIYTGSSVIQVKMHFQEYWSPPALPRVTGDSVVVNVIGHTPVFVLLRTPTRASWAGSIPFELFRDRLPVSGSVRERTRALLALRDKAERPAKHYPTMVAFHDIADPKSVYQVVADDMSPPLDPDSRVINMTIEMTSDSVTYQVEKLLPWLPDTYDAHLDGDRYETPGKSLANSLSQPIS